MKAIYTQKEEETQKKQVNEGCGKIEPKSPRAADDDDIVAYLEEPNAISMNKQEPNISMYEKGEVVGNAISMDEEEANNPISTDKEEANPISTDGSQDITEHQGKPHVNLDDNSEVLAIQGTISIDNESSCGQDMMKEHQAKTNADDYGGEVGCLKVAHPRKGTKHAPWIKPETKAGVSAEPVFFMEVCSWPTLAEAHLPKPSEAPASKDTDFPSPLPASPDQDTGSSKQTTAKPAPSGSNYKSSYKRGNIWGHSKPSSPAGEHLPYPPMGVHVVNANMVIPDQSMRGNVVTGVNGGPYHVPFHTSFYHHAPFPGTPVNGGVSHDWQHYGRGYGNINAGFWQPCSQPFGPRNLYPPFMTMGPYNYPNFLYDSSFKPGTPAPGHHYSGLSRDLMHGPDQTTLQTRLQKQIEYYFSPENLCHDTFLTSKMDEEGYVPLSLIASFPRVKALTVDHCIILEALKNSSVVELKGEDKLRSRDWINGRPHQ